MDVVHGGGMIDHAGVVVVHAIDVGPDLDLLSPDGGAYERSGIVGTSTLEVVYIPCGVAADKALGDVEVGLLLLQHVTEMVGYVRNVRLSRRVQAHEIEGGKEHYVLALLLQVEREHVGGHDLSLGQDFLLLDRTEMLAGKGAEESKHACENLAGLVGIFLR